MARAAALKLRHETWRLPNDSDAEKYKAAVASIFDVDLHDDGAGFHNCLETFHLGDVIIGKFTGSGQTFTRTAGHIALDGVDHLQLVLTLEGSWSGDYEGRVASSEMGAMRLVDMGRPFRTVATPYVTLNLMAPRSLLGPHANHDFHGAVLMDHRPSSRLLRAHLEMLWACAHDLSVGDGAAERATLGALIAAVLGDQTPARRLNHKALDRTLHAVVRGLVDSRPEGVVLDPSGLCAYLAVSRSVLYRAFEPHGGVMAFMRDRRLDKAFQALATRKSSENIAAIAHAHGFASESHFSRAFLDRFKVRPGDVSRTAGADQDGLAGFAKGSPETLTWVDRL